MELPLRSQGEKPEEVSAMAKLSSLLPDYLIQAEIWDQILPQILPPAPFHTILHLPGDS